MSERGRVRELKKKRSGLREKMKGLVDELFYSVLVRWFMF